MQSMIAMKDVLFSSSNYMHKSTFRLGAKLAGAIILLFFVAATARAQLGLTNVHPNLSRGSGDDKTMERYDPDSVNLFNGNLSISIPLGIKYPLARSFGYSFSANYNSSVWDLDNPGSTIAATPIKYSNAGFGWDVSFGRLIPPVASGMQTGRWVYVSPDGKYHPFYSTLHHDVSENDPNDTALYTRDGSYYRLIELSPTQRFVEAPDGTQSLFELINGEWRLKQIGDRFVNRLWLSYGTNLLTLSDNHGRLHRIYYKADTTGSYPALVDRIELSAFNGTTATYTFTYATQVVSRPSADTEPATSATVSMPVLASITIPDGSKYNFNYHGQGSQDVSGRIAGMQLPTLGRINWTYTTYKFTDGGRATNLGPMYKTNVGAGGRSLVDAAGNVIGTWTYAPSLKPGASSPPNGDVIWVGDSLPAGATSVGNWTWASANPAPFSGASALQSNSTTGLHQHYFHGATSTLTVNAGDSLVAYVYLDPTNPPSQVMLQWNDGTWEHRAYWGANQLPWGVNGTHSRLHMGPLPAVGQWVRLEVPASLVGLEGRTLNGMAFSLYNGRATWDNAGKSSASNLADQELSNTVVTPVGDKTVYYFSVNTTSSGPDWKKGDYALPITKNEFDRQRVATTNVALASNGATASADSTLNSGYPAGAVINGDRKGLNWGSGGGWNDGTTNWFPDTLQVAFSASKTIGLINVFTLQDNYNNPIEPTLDLSFAQHGIQDFSVQYWNGSAWTAVPSGSVIGNNKVWRQFIFSPITTDRIRIVVNKAPMSSRIVEVEAFESVIPQEARFLSKQIYDCDVSGSNCRLLRSVYVRYEQDELTDPAFADAGNTNRREASQRTLYHDDVENGVARFAETDWTDFDGVGHYRRKFTNGNFGSADVRESYVNYDASTGSYPSAGFSMPSTWVLNTFSQQRMVEGSSSQTIDFCFDKNTGSLKRIRRWYNSSPSLGKTNQDIVAVYTANQNGETVQEQYYGGDIQAVGTGDLCNLVLPATDQYQLRHTYQFGGRASSQYYTADGQTFGAKSLDQTIDKNTGLVATGRDSAGIATAYDYDLLGRLIWVKPQSGHGAWTNTVYVAATGPSWNGAKKTVNTVQNSGSASLKYEAVVYDGFGYPLIEQTRMPDGSFPYRVKNYNAMGWLTSSSEFSVNTPQVTQYLDQDPFGRVRIVRPPDGSHHDIRYEYLGEKSVKKVSSTALWQNHSTGEIIESPRAISTVYDRRGRPWKTIRHARPEYTSSLDAVLINTYDAVDRLRYTTVNNKQMGNRNEYDGRGFLFYILDEAGGTTRYNNFDAMGKSLKQQFSTTFLAFTYDRAGRLVKVSDFNNPSKIYKEFIYASSNGQENWSSGKLQTAKRYNYIPEIPNLSPYLVTETFTYGGRGGRMSKYEIELNDPYNRHDKYAQNYAYNELGQIEETIYPAGQTPDSGSLNRERKVIYDYSNGFLAGIRGSRNDSGVWTDETWANSIVYHSNGLISQVAHANGVTDNIANDPNGFARISSVHTTGVKSWPGQPDQNFYSGQFVYDGTKSLVKVGDKTFIAPQGYQPPPEHSGTVQGGPCQDKWQDPFNLPIAAGYINGCSPNRRFFYNAGDIQVMQIDYTEDKRTWFFYDQSGAPLSEYLRRYVNGAWLSTRDYLYRGGSRLATDERSPTAPPNVTHYHIGYGSPGLKTDGNGYRLPQ